MEIEIPSSVGQVSSSVPSQAVGFLSRKGEDYEAYVVADLDGERTAEKDKKKSKGKGKRTKDDVEDEDRPAEDAGHGGREMRSLVPLLPKHSAGNKLFVGKQLFVCRLESSPVLSPYSYRRADLAPFTRDSPPQPPARSHSP